MAGTLAVQGPNFTRWLCAWVGVVTLGIAAFASLLLLLPGLVKPRQFLRTLGQRVSAAAGLLGISYAVCDFFWRRYGGLVRSRWLAISFYVGWHILGGVFLAMLIAILCSKNIKLLVSVSGALLVMVDALVVLAYSTGLLAGALIFPSLSIGLLIGVFAYCGVLLRFSSLEKETRFHETTKTFAAEKVASPTDASPGS